MMNIGARIVVVIWLLIVARFVGTLIASRHCLRLRHAKKIDKPTYELLTAFGVGMGLYAISDFGLTIAGVTGLPTAVAATFPWSYTAQLFFWHSVQTIGVWTITLVLMNGGAPGKLRELIFFILKKVGFMTGS